jgi:hypothetical protein
MSFFGARYWQRTAARLAGCGRGWKALDIIGFKQQATTGGTGSTGKASRHEVWPFLFPQFFPVVCPVSPWLENALELFPLTSILNSTRTLNGRNYGRQSLTLPISEVPDVPSSAAQDPHLPVSLVQDRLTLRPLSCISKLITCFPPCRSSATLQPRAQNWFCTPEDSDHCSARLIAPLFRNWA